MGNFHPDLGNLRGFCSAGCGSLVTHGDTQEHPASAPSLSTICWLFLQGLLRHLPNPKSPFPPQIKAAPAEREASCSDIREFHQDPACSITSPSSAEHLHSRSGGQDPTSHSLILKNKLFVLLGNEGKEQLCWDRGQGCRLHFNFSCNRWFSLAPKDLLLLLSKCLPSTLVRKWSRKYFPEVLLVLLFSYAFCWSVCLHANIS